MVYVCCSFFTCPRHYQVSTALLVYLSSHLCRHELSLIINILIDSWTKHNNIPSYSRPSMAKITWTRLSFHRPVFAVYALIPSIHLPDYCLVRPFLLFIYPANRTASFPQGALDPPPTFRLTISAELSLMYLRRRRRRREKNNTISEGTEPSHLPSCCLLNTINRP